MKKLRGNVKVLVIAYLAVLLIVACIVLKVTAEGEGNKQEKKAAYSSSVQVQGDKNEQAEAKESNGAEENGTAEANEAGESQKGKQNPRE